jgi:hypothetical protein
MNARRLFFTLFRFNAQVLPSNVWMFVAIINWSYLGLILLTFDSEGLPFLGVGDSFGNCFDNFPIIICGILGIFFFSVGAGTTRTIWTLPTGSDPNGEFLLVRPVPRRAVYLSRIVLFFLIMVSGPLLKIGLTILDPDLRLSFIHGTTSNNETADNLNFYRSQFPDSSVIHMPDVYYGKLGNPNRLVDTDVLVVPFGVMLIAFWQLWLVIFLALAMQTATVLTLSPKVQGGILVAICQAPVLMFILDPIGKHPMLMENVFFFFAHHWLLIALFTLGLLVLVQRIALQRIQELEVI